jgi:erythritol transport system permease protein
MTEMANETTASTTVSRHARANRSARRLMLLLLKGRTLVVLLLLMVVFNRLSSAYLTHSNLVLMTKHVSINAILAIGETFVILTAGIDLSVGSIAGLAGMVTGALLYKGFPLLGHTIFLSALMAILVGLLVGTGVGAVNGIVTTRLRVAPFIATLGVLYVARGAADLSSNGGTFPNLAGARAHGNTGFSIVGVGTWIGVPVEVWIMIVVGALAILVTARTPFGRRIYAVGGNQRAAVLAGIRINRIKLAAYMISGACAALAGLMLTSELGAAYPDTATTYELNAIAAAVLGGTSLFGGKGTIVGTIMGAFVIGFLGDGLVLVGVSSFWQLVVKGGVIVFAVVLNQAQEGLQTRVAPS